MAFDIFRHQHRVAYAECTLGNHVYYARYLEMLETARGEFFRHLGTTFLAWQDGDAIFPVIECRIRYKSAARYDDLLTIEVWIAALGRVRMNFAYRILNENTEIVLEAETFHVCTSRDEKLKRLPKGLADLLKPFVHGASSMPSRFETFLPPITASESFPIADKGRANPPAYPRRLVP